MLCQIVHHLSYCALFFIADNLPGTVRQGEVHTHLTKSTQEPTRVHVYLKAGYTCYAERFMDT